MLLRRLPLILLAVFLAQPAHAQKSELESDLNEDQTYLRVLVGGKQVRLEALIVKRANATGRLPVALIAHGKPATQGRMLDEHVTDYVRQARDLARRGWLAVVVMRRGFGASDGPMPVQIGCASTSFLERFAADADDLAATLSQVSQRNDADPARILAIGVSAGGAAVTALSARNPKGLVAVVNVSGGVRFQACPKEDMLVAAFKTYGATSRVPTLWVYAQNDSFFGPALVEKMREAYLGGGADVKLVMLEPDKRADGHTIFSTPFGRQGWLPQMDAFLRHLKLPTVTRADVDALMKKLGAKETSRGFFERYVGGPSERALARQKAGSYYGAGHGTRAGADARKVALETCEKQGSPCEIIMENDRWVAAEP